MNDRPEVVLICVQGRQGKWGLYIGNQLVKVSPSAQDILKCLTDKAIINGKTRFIGDDGLEDTGQFPIYLPDLRIR